jgi:hypothetical protein
MEKADVYGPVSEFRRDLGPCWFWTASLTRMGYGGFYFRGQMTTAQRAAFRLFVIEVGQSERRW